MEVYDFFILYLDNNLYSCYTWNSSCPDGKTDLSNKFKVNTATARLQTYISVIKFSASLKQPLLYFTLISWKYAHKKTLIIRQETILPKSWEVLLTNHSALMTLVSTSFYPLLGVMKLHYTNYFKHACAKKCLKFIQYRNLWPRI